MAMVGEAGLSGLPLPQLVGRAGVAWDSVEALVGRLERQGMATRIEGVLVAAADLAAVEAPIMSALTRYHSDHPLEDGMPREELRERFFATAPVAVFDHVLRTLAAQNRLIARDRVALAGHSVALTDEEARARDAMITLLKEAALAPPDAATLAVKLSVAPAVVNRLAALLVRRSVLVRAGDLIFHESALVRLKAEVQSLKQAGVLETLDVGTFKDRYNVSRKFAIPLLEFLDRERVTRRVGETRKIL
jgi:selenocysteine-specific elongation factor